MGQPKMVLPWGNTTVLGRVIRVMKSADIEDIVVVTGAARELVEAICRAERARTVFNRRYGEGEMLASLQTGLRKLGATTKAALVALGDQPQIQESCVRLVVRRYEDSRAPLVVPSYNRRRGHPWVVGREFWEEILGMSEPESPREFLNRHAADISYVDLDSPTIMQDLDTPEDYLKSRP
jgi:molybdenum cofactor cytidylyltransferase